MNAVKSMLLDLKACKAYWKNMIYVFIILGIIVINLSKIVAALFFAIFFILLPFWQYPFAIYDKCSLLYLSLPQKKSDIVLGRYFLAVLGIIAAFILSAGVGFIYDPQMLKSGEMFLIASICTLFSSIIISIQAPVFFRFGYMKSRIFAVASIGVIAGIIGFVFSSLIAGMKLETVKNILSGSQKIVASPVISVILLIISAIVITISYRISLSFFEFRQGKGRRA